MTPELYVLTLAGLWQVVQFALAAIPANRELGPAKTMSPRDPQRMDKPLTEQMSLRTGRLFRALNNHFEALILFTIAVVTVSLSGSSGWFTTACAWVYLAARILYVPAYAYGWVPGRSIIFAVGLGATTLMLLAALF
ncbi:MAPEG family protein [Mesobaculum littorinae]|uniref:MAPEG family protein n=1 Tax=Mesobaculum littorinae TaxID=2486419 RepID=A0A438AD65_9RHOB|nr:MAPEG family protein [Mesobaculum littorinae]RVV96624.1 MAPEG family protein [Mesobaculum littorinae]